MNYHDLNYLDFSKNSEQLIFDIKNIIRNGSGICIIKNLPISEDNIALIELSEKLGEPISEKRNIDDKTVYRVEINKDLEVPTYANTEYEFWCHTDCAEYNEPPDTILLLCENPSETGGESFVIHIDEIKAQLSNLEIFNLGTKAYPFRNYYYPIITLESEDKLNIRYNRTMIDFTLQLTDIKLEEKYIHLMDKLDQIINDSKYVFKLNKGECLITSNKTILHGRAAFPPTEKRLMKRIRLYLN